MRNRIIISGAYGLVLATESICRYESLFYNENWQDIENQKHFLGEVSLEYAKKNSLTHVRIIVTTGKSYEQFARSVEWNRGRFNDVILLGFHSSNKSNEHLTVEGKCFVTLLNSTGPEDFDAAFANLLVQYPNVHFQKEVLSQQDR